MNTNIYQDLLQFYISAEKLKIIMRHSYTSNSERQESTAEHSWMLCLIAITLFEHLTIQINQLKTLKMLIIHDLAEAVTGDIPAFDTERRIGKYEREKEAMTSILSPLPKSMQKEFLSLWEECEARETNEAKVAQAIDKLEAPFQHNLFSFEKWEQQDFDIHGWYKFDIVAIDPFLKKLREEIEDMSRKKITEGGMLEKLPEKIQQKYQELNNHEK